MDGRDTQGWPHRRPGDQDQVVRSIQHLLNAHGASLAADGVFGPQTELALRQFQADQVLPEDGVVGEHTWPALVIEVAKGASGEAVRAAQAQLYRRGTLPAVDGVFSMPTDVSLRRFQMFASLPVTGVVSLQTWQALVGDEHLPAGSMGNQVAEVDWKARLKGMLRPDG
jgi:peptidoglycan hydrolase-like protein with peptidoglycan-binding domain